MKKAFIIVVFLSALLLSFTLSAQENLRVEKSLAEGWNLVYGLFYLNQVDTGSQVTPTDIKAIYLYVPSKNKYARIHPSPSDKDIELIQSLDDEYVSQNAFWIYSSKAGLLTYNLIEPAQPLHERIVYKGWNFMGVTQDMVESPLNPGLTLKDIKGNCLIEKAYAFIENKWVTLDPFPMEDNLLYDGLLIKSGNDCTLGPSKSTSSPPTPPL